MSDPGAQLPVLRSPDEVPLVELINRLLDRGVVVKGDVVISIAGVDLLYLGVELLLASTATIEDTLKRRAAAAAGGAPPLC
jgi:hypothetical protein